MINEILLPASEIVELGKDRLEGSLVHVISIAHAKNRMIVSGHDFVYTSFLRLVMPHRRTVWQAGIRNLILLSVPTERYVSKIIVEIGLQNALLELSRGKTPSSASNSDARCIGGTCVTFCPIQSFELALPDSLFIPGEMLPLYVDFDSIEPASLSGLSIFTVRVTFLECYINADNPSQPIYEFTSTPNTPLLTLTNTPAATARTLFTPHVLQGARPWSRPTQLPNHTQLSKEVENRPICYQPLHSSEYICLSSDCHPTIKNLKVTFASEPVRIKARHEKYV